MSIKENVEKIKSGLPDDVLLVGVTKTRSVEEINEAIDAGITDIGENKVQEVMDKFDGVKQVNWHFIGHLQRNKVKYIIDKVSLIHSVDSIRLANEIDKRAAEHGLIMDILIQINPADEESKFGVSLGETKDLLMEIADTCSNIRIRGLMSVAPFTEDPEDVGTYFAQVKDLYDELGKINHERIDFKYLSMGMSHDYEVAVTNGSNLVRVGTAIFGPRDYTK